MRFPIVLADPSWSYRDKALAGDRGAECKYPVMSDAEIYALPVQSVSADDSVLFLWVTMPKLAEGLACMKAWGFDYKTCAFTWVKPNQPFATVIDWIGKAREGYWSEFEIPRMVDAVKTHWAIGMGRWTRANAELVLLGTRGKPSRIDAGVNQVVCAPAAQHSAKPPEVRDRIVRLMGDQPRVELFAREQAAGWTALGYDVDGQDLRVSLPSLARLSEARWRLAMRSQRPLSSESRPQPQAA
jgi:N6-adenosine-specific RNA methylase IME4